ncbi:MAG: class I SAM-dependent methyltransferase [Solirubrobacteraceae bacterium]|nr:class I SAM-dependent methyltransferase [Solirubrobacteraceae bacterium]
MALAPLRRVVRVAPIAPDLVGRALLGRLARRIAGRSIDTATGPGINTRATIDADPRATVAALLPGITVDQLDAYEREYLAVDHDLIQRAGSRELPMPSIWRTEHGTGLALYTLARALGPEVVVETGIANGWSSVIFLRALQQNGRGRLHSFDVRDDVGRLVDPAERERWQLHLLRPATLGAFDRTIAGLDPIGLFFHDSDHSYLHMRLELRMAGARLAPGGALCSDDVSLSHAYVEACEELGVMPRLLVDGHKASGFAVR